jgi:hypothetical protein
MNDRTKLINGSHANPIGEFDKDADDVHGGTEPHPPVQDIRGDDDRSCMGGGGVRLTGCRAVVFGLGHDFPMIFVELTRWEATDTEDILKRDLNVPEQSTVENETTIL